jgi:hypothetical protein
MTQTIATDTMTQTSATQRSSEQADAIRPFHVNFPEADLTELRRRINATKWPDRETVTDQSQGVQLATIQALARYWPAPQLRKRQEGSGVVRPEGRRSRRHSCHEDERCSSGSHGRVQRDNTLKEEVGLV